MQRARFLYDGRQAMRRLCLFSGGLALAAALYVYAVHAAPWPLLLGLAVLCGGLFLLRKAGTRRAAVCEIGRAHV